MPYRYATVASQSGQRSTFRVRISDEAVEEWLRERIRLRASGYPDRPPDIDTPTLRAWLPRTGEEALPYFSGRRTEAEDIASHVFPVYAASWHGLGDIVTKVILTGFGDGSFLCRVLMIKASGICPVDKARRHSPDVDPSAVWSEVETIVRFINEAPMGWGSDDPLVTDYADFLALDAEFEIVEADAKAAGHRPH